MPAARSGWWRTTASSGLSPMAFARILAGACLALAFSGSACARGPIAPVQRMDLPGFMGRWYVIASISTRFEKDGYDAVETYRLQGDGSICTSLRFRPGGFDAPVKLIHSQATVVPGRGNAEWKVHLFWFMHAQYLVGWLAPDGNQVLVVRDARDYLWYMARTPTVGAADYRAMLARAEALGYDIAKVRRTPQRWPEKDPGSKVFESPCR